MIQKSSNIEDGIAAAYKRSGRCGAEFMRRITAFSRSVQGYGRVFFYEFPNLTLCHSFALETQKQCILKLIFNLRIRFSFVVYIVMNYCSYRSIERHYRFLASLSVDLELPSSPLERADVELLKLRKTESIGEEKNKYGFITLFCLFPVGSLFFSQALAGGHCIQHDHDFVILKSLDLAFAGFRNTDGIETVCDILVHHFIPVKVFEENRNRGFLAGQRFVVIGIISYHIILDYFIFSAVVYEKVDVYCLYLIEIRKFDLVSGLSFRQIRFVNEILEKEPYVMKVCKSCHGKHVALEVRKIPPEKPGKLFLKIFALHVYVVFLFDNVVRLVGLVMYPYFSFLCHYSVISCFILSMAPSSPSSVMFTQFISSYLLNQVSWRLARCLVFCLILSIASSMVYRPSKYAIISL